MSESNIYQSLRKNGLSEAGACAMMGNMYCESTLKSSIVEKRNTMSDEEYTRRVDNGQISETTFIYDTYGYGLCQWTHYSRKDNLYNFAKSRGVSISDEAMQCDFCIGELKQSYPGLYTYLCSTVDLYKATERICKEFERPAVNNVSDRYKAATGYFDKRSTYGTAEQGSTPIGTSSVIPMNSVSVGTTESCEVHIRMVRNGDKGRDVLLLQNALNDMGYNCGMADGDFGGNTLAALARFKKEHNLTPIGVAENGIADQGVWQIIFQ